jgi:lipoprotein-releasing system permease protein
VKSLTWALALRFLLSPISSLSYVSKLALTGLIVSTGVLLLVLSVVNGFDRELRERVLGITPHFSVALPGGAVPADIHTDIE